MTDLLGSLTTEMRITSRIIRETLMGLKRTGWMNLIIVVTMASILSIFGVFIAIIIEMKGLIYNIGSELEISAYLKDGASIEKVKEEILALPHIRKLTVITKQKAWEDMQRDYPLPAIDNPLPDTIHVQMNREELIPSTVETIKGLPDVEAVQYPKKVLDKIRGVTQVASAVGIACSLFLGILTLFIISNTIHLLIQAKQREIEILRMMGVGNWYIRLPFLIQGAVYGLTGALISFMPLFFAVTYLSQFLNYLGFQPNDMTGDIVRILLALMGMLVGAGGAAVAIRKYLEV